MKARKEYYCMAWPWLENGVESLEGFSFAEKRAIVLAKRARGKIKKGDTYLYQSLSVEGTVQTFRAIPAIHQICINHELYEYEYH